MNKIYLHVHHISEGLAQNISMYIIIYLGLISYLKRATFSMQYVSVVAVVITM